MENLTKEQAIEICAYCGWIRGTHRNGYCYHYSDEDTDYFYTDKKFTASGSVAAPKEHIYTDKEIIALAEKELEKVTAENERLSAEIKHLHSVIATMCKTIKTE